MIQNLKSMFIYPQIISDATGEVIDDIYEYFGPDYLKVSMEYGPDSQHAKKLFDLVTKLDNFPEIFVKYSENLSQELNPLRNFLIDLLTVEISTTNCSEFFSYECLSSKLVPDPEGNKSLSITVIKCGDYLYLNFILRNHHLSDDNSLRELESDLKDTQDRRSIEFPYILNDIFIFPNDSQITTIWSPREI